MSTRNLWLLLSYLSFVIYGSLIPFEYRHHEWSEALVLFRNIPFLDLGVLSRADWIANIVLYIPLAVLACRWLASILPAIATIFTLPLAMFICLGTAIGVEFAQIFFAPRTVSLNDLLAETIGSTLGLTFWHFRRRWLDELVASFVRGGQGSILAVLSAYGLFYLATSLFPFDFLISMEELRWKLNSAHHGILLAANDASMIARLARLAGELVAILPLALLATLAFPSLDPRKLLVVGLIIGLLLEFFQFFLASGISQGLSVVSRGLGLGAGVLLGARLTKTGPARLQRWIYKAVPWLVLPYALALMLIAGWFDAAWLPPSAFFEELAKVKLIPLYYHYYSSEPVAMASLLAHVTMYAPVGVYIWARSGAASRPQARIPGQMPGGQHKPAPYRRRGARGLYYQAALVTLALTLVIELGKVLAPQEHPDFTNLLIAMAGACASLAFLRWLEHILLGGETDSSSAPSHEAKAKESDGRQAQKPSHLPSASGLAFTLVCGGALSLGLYNYPLHTPLLASLLGIYGLLLWRNPTLWWFAVPFLLPVLDFSPYTGHLALDAFDLVVLCSLLIAGWRCRDKPKLPWPSALAFGVFALLALSWALSAGPGLYTGFQEFNDGNTGSHSGPGLWNACKGLLWALALISLGRRYTNTEQAHALRYLIAGLACGLVALSLSVVWERIRFVGLFDFDTEFRVTGGFASMNTGGAYIEAYIALAFPALLIWVLRQRRPMTLGVGLGLVGIAGYSMLVTYARVGYAALLFGVLAVFLLWLGTGVAHDGGTWLSRVKRGGMAMALLGLSAAVVAPVLNQGFAQYRLQRSGEDLAFRVDHWRNALVLTGNSPAMLLSGAGFGQYPRYHLLDPRTDEPSAWYRIAHDGDNPYLHLQSGATAYVEQILNTEPGGEYQFSFLARADTTASLRVHICEKALLHSFNCGHDSLDINPGKDWQHYTLQLSQPSPESDIADWRPLKLSLEIESGAADLDTLTLRQKAAPVWIRNGDFSALDKHWLFVSDPDLAWHIHQQWLDIYFAQGGLGIMANLLLVAMVLKRLLSLSNLHRADQAALVIGFAALAIVGLLGSTTDNSRIALLWYFVGLTCLLIPNRTIKARGLST